jgi:hypothetical protein
VGSEPTRIGLGVGLVEAWAIAVGEGPLLGDGPLLGANGVEDAVGARLEPVG